MAADSSFEVVVDVDGGVVSFVLPLIVLLSLIFSSFVLTVLSSHLTNSFRFDSVGSVGTSNRVELSVSLFFSF